MIALRDDDVGIKKEKVNVNATIIKESFGQKSSADIRVGISYADL